MPPVWMDEEKVVNVNEQARLSGENEEEFYPKPEAKSRASQEQIYKQEKKEEVLGQEDDEYYGEEEQYQKGEKRGQVTVDNKKDNKEREEPLGIVNNKREEGVAK